MRYVRFQDRDGVVAAGILTDDKIRRIEGGLFAEHRATSKEYGREEVKLLAPVCPGKIIGIGANYRSFLDAKKMSYPQRPKVFLKPSTAVIASKDPIICPDPAHVVQFEGELAVVIGSVCSHVPAEKAMSYIFGYTCINDVTDRTMLEEDGIWTRGKGSDTFAPIGPCITDEICGTDVLLTTRVNGEVRQHMRTSDMYFPIPELIAYLSTYMTLLPGDVIATGTPDGAGPLAIGDTVEVEIEQIGVLRNQRIR